MVEQSKQIQSWLKDGLSKRALAQNIGIAPATLQRLLTGGHPSERTQALVRRYAQSQRWYLFLDETFKDQTQITISATLIAPGQDLNQFKQVVYPQGWQKGGKEIKAQGKSDVWLQNLFARLKSDAAKRYALRTKIAPITFFPEGIAVLLPYLQAAFLVIQHERIHGEMAIILDQRSDFMRESYASAIYAMMQADPGNLQVSLAQGDSKRSLGIQSSDFVARAASRWSVATCAKYGITILDDQIESARSLVNAFHQQSAVRPGSTRAVLLQLFELAKTITSWSTEPLIYTNQLAMRFQEALAILPNHFPAGFKLPPQRNWYVLVAQIALVLRTSESQWDQSKPSAALTSFVQELEELVTTIQALQPK